MLTALTPCHRWASGAAHRAVVLAHPAPSCARLQALLMRLLRTHVSSIVGEEDEAAIHIDGDGPFRAAEIEAPAALVPLIVRLRERMDVLSASLGTHEELKGLTAFVDPIDGTKEFCSGLGEQCSICVGLADAAGAAVTAPSDPLPAALARAGLDGVPRVRLGAGGGASTAPRPAPPRAAS